MNSAVALVDFRKRLDIDIFVEAVHRAPLRAETQARNVVVQPVEPGVGERREHEVGNGAAIDRAIGLAKRSFRFG